MTISLWLRRFGESDLYRLIAPVLLVGCLFIASMASVGTFVVYRTQATESAKRVAAISELQECFDEYATASSATSKRVRNASTALSSAQMDRDRALQALYEYASDVQAGRSDPQRARAVFAVLLAANAVLVGRHERLAKVRAQNPVPNPPSSFCDVQP